MTEAELKAAESGRRVGVKDVELAIIHQYEPALKADNYTRLADLKIALRIVRELFPELAGTDGRTACL